MENTNKTLTGESLVEDIFEFIRADEKLGRGSMSTYDECYNDEELKGEIRENLLVGTFCSATGAIFWFNQLEQIRLEREEIGLW